MQRPLWMEIWVTPEKSNGSGWLAALTIYRKEVAAVGWHRTSRSPSLAWVRNMCFSRTQYMLLVRESSFEVTTVIPIRRNRPHLGWRKSKPPARIGMLLSSSGILSGDFYQGCFPENMHKYQQEKYSALNISQAQPALILDCCDRTVLGGTSLLLIRLLPSSLLWARKDSSRRLSEESNKKLAKLLPQPRASFLS